MKNLFLYANKELTQDAFFHWLFENWKEQPFYEIVNKLFKEFCQVKNDEIIASIESKTQLNHIDLTFYITTKSNKKYTLFIEDKAFTNEHNQLKTYNEKIKKMRWIDQCLVRKIFYKTSTINPHEKEVVEKAGWKIYDINKIQNLFSFFTAGNKNLIVNQYIEYLDEIQKASQFAEKPTTNDGHLDFLKWESYFKKISAEILKNHGYKKDNIGKVSQYPYVSLIFTKKDSQPFLDIRSRDLIAINKKNSLKNPFVARLVFYGVEQDKNLTISDIKNKQIEIESFIQKRGFFTIKKVNKSARHGFYKQLGVYSSKHEIDNDQKFVEELEKCMQEYDAILKIWNKD